MDNCMRTISNVFLSNAKKHSNVTMRGKRDFSLSFSRVLLISSLYRLATGCQRKSNMPSKGQKFIDEFLKPNLNSRRFGTRLMWLSKEYPIFQVQWHHKSASGWTKEDAEVFMEWDKIKGRHKPDDKDRFTKSKQRFRAIMYKLMKAEHITEISSDDKCTKYYCFGCKKNIPREIIAESIKYGRIFIWEMEPSNDRMYDCKPESLNEMMCSKENIPSEVIAENLKSGEILFCESNEKIYDYDNAVISNRNDISEKIYNQCYSFEDHEYASTFYRTTYVNIICENLSEKQEAMSGLEGSYTQDSNDSENIVSNNVLLWNNVKLEDMESTAYEPRFEESPFVPDYLL